MLAAVDIVDDGATGLAVVPEAIVVPINTLGTVDYKLAVE